nr:helix-turn-helix transcriptional regulator [Roseospira navarrensis]
MRTQRLHLRMSQEQLAQAVGVTFQQIQKYERGANRISASRLYDIASVMGVPINFFFDHIEDFIKDRPQGHGVAEPRPTFEAPSTVPTEQINLVTAYWKLPSDDIRKKALALLCSMSGLKEKKGEPVPDD